MKPSRVKALIKGMLASGMKCRVILVGYPGIGKTSIALSAIKEAGFRPVSHMPKEGEVFIDSIHVHTNVSPIAFERAVLICDTPEPDLESFWNEDFIPILVEPDLEDWKAWALSHGIRPEVVSYLTYRPERLMSVMEKRVEEEDDEVIFQFNTKLYKLVSPSNWEQASDLLSMGDVGREAIPNLLGRVIAYDFLSFLDEFERVEGALLEGVGPSPDDDRAQYALLGALLKHPELVESHAGMLRPELRRMLEKDLKMLRPEPLPRESTLLPGNPGVTAEGFSRYLLSLDKTRMMVGIYVLAANLASYLDEATLKDVKSTFESGLRLKE